jgi:predicted dinucleotide-binding enzyme
VTDDGRAFEEEVEPLIRMAGFEPMKAGALARDA